MIARVKFLSAIASLLELCAPDGSVDIVLRLADERVFEALGGASKVVRVIDEDGLVTTVGVREFHAPFGLTVTVYGPAHVEPLVIVTPPAT